jgi:nucleoside-diphosphate-sugar epimerase
MSDILILGGGGFVGTAIQDRVSAASKEYVFTRSRHGHSMDHARSLELDLLDAVQVAEVSRFDRAIWVAGGADHRLGNETPEADLELQVLALLRFLEHFRGSLTLLSSQATYYGLTGEVQETVDHVPSMPYGLGKLAAEKYAEWALDAGRLRGLWVHRLMYAFGVNERKQRLLARCTRASRDGGRVTIRGGGRSFLNPLPVQFVADVLLRTATQLESEPIGFFQLTNLNHPERWTVADVVEAYAENNNFDYELTENGEDWPVTFYGNVVKLSHWLGGWGMAFPDVGSSLVTYAQHSTAETDG